MIDTQQHNTTHRIQVENCAKVRVPKKQFRRKNEKRGNESKIKSEKNQNQVFVGF